jgi:hypothetical protein
VRRFSDIVIGMKGLIAAGAVLLAMTGGVVRAQATTTLYDASAGGTPPTSQGWLTYFSSTFTNLFTSDATGTTLDTNGAAGTQAGFSNHSVVTGQVVNPAFPALDRNAGFTVHLEDLRVLSETHASTDRAGTSLIVLASDRKGIELGFWEGLIFAQNDTPLFTHGEQASFNTTVAHDYDLRIQGSTYALFADGSPLLTGPLRDYAAFGGFPDPYELPNFLFLGDDTGSASAAVRFAGVSVTVPEPAALSLLAVTPLLLRRRRARATASSQ